MLIEKAVCMHEEDTGLLWKHVEYRTNHSEVRRSRRLVLSFVATVRPAPSTSPKQRPLPLPRLWPGHHISIVQTLCNLLAWMQCSTLIHRTHWQCLGGTLEPMLDLPGLLCSMGH